MDAEVLRSVMLPPAVAKTETLPAAVCQEMTLPWHRDARFSPQRAPYRHIYTPSQAMPSRSFQVRPVTSAPLLLVSRPRIRWLGLIAHGSPACR
ncbi:hypothetical protein B0T16DRAFT_249683 [Cercophora newfieldiana]|uniref:Uncharacterized protein n=1 Tax=Cercophora newfieldiana TaxID=92897 RepID=A0AA40CIS6_9PEZI|nr:hypothetical protein B0T16DRAFT_249683 [Cercophora newfieldiana]